MKRCAAIVVAREKERAGGGALHKKIENNLGRILHCSEGRRFLRFMRCLREILGFELRFCAKLFVHTDAREGPLVKISEQLSASPCSSGRQMLRRLLKKKGGVPLESRGSNGRLMRWVARVQFFVAKRTSMINRLGTWDTRSPHFESRDCELCYVPGATVARPTLT
jgi:hypothetical protein